MTTLLKTPLSSSWSVQMTPHLSASFRTVTSLLTDRRLRSWLSGAVLTTWSLTRSKLWWPWTSGETSLHSPQTSPTHHHEQLCDCSGVIQIPGHHNFSGPEVGQSHWVYGGKGPANAILPSPAEEVQPATGAVDTVLLIIESVLCTSITVWFSSATKSDLRRLRRVVRTAERIIGTTLSTLQELYSSRVSKRAGKITLNPSHPAHSTRYKALRTRNNRTQFLPSCNPSHEHLKLSEEHTTLLYVIYSPHIFQICTCQTSHIIVCIVFAILYNAYLYIVLLLSVSCHYHSVALWNFCHYNKFLVCVNIAGQ